MVKSRVTGNEAIHYPKLMRASNGMIVLFTEAEAGTVVHKGEGGHTVGTHADDWNPRSFQDFPGTVTLEN